MFKFAIRIVFTAKQTLFFNVGTNVANANQLTSTSDFMLNLFNIVFESFEN